VEPVGALEPRGVDRVELRRDAAVGEHRPPAGAVDERDHDAAPAGDDLAAHLDAVPLDLLRHELARSVVAAPADHAGRGAELDRPGGDVRGLPPGSGPCQRRGVAVGGRRGGGADDHVEEQVAEGADQHAYNRFMDGQERGSGRLRSFVLGGLVGASAALAAAKRNRPQRRARRTTPVGLAAFEEAPCYRELVEREDSLRA
jgi:hypothetical protein